MAKDRLLSATECATVDSNVNTDLEGPTSSSSPSLYLMLFLSSPQLLLPPLSGPNNSLTLFPGLEGALWALSVLTRRSLASEVGPLPFSGCSISPMLPSGVVRS